VPLITLSDCRNNLARIAAGFAAILVSASRDFSKLIVEAEHIRMAGEFLDQVYSHENCGLDEHSDIMRIGSQLTDYDQIEQAFLEKWKQEKHAADGKESFFPKLIFILRVSPKIRRDDLAEQAGCSVDTVRRAVRLLKRFNLIDTTRDGYVKKPKCNKFLRRFIPAHPDFFEDPDWGAGSNLFEDKELDAISR